MKRLLLVAGVLLAVVAPAQASTVIESENPRYQEWADASLVPTPDVTIEVIEDLGCGVYPQSTSCYYPDLDLIRFVVGDLRPRMTFYHELAHAFDHHVMDERDRAAFAAMRPVHGWHNEYFAESYALCAKKREFRGADELAGGIGIREQTRLCRMIERWPYSGT